MKNCQFKGFAVSVGFHAAVLLAFVLIRPYALVLEKGLPMDVSMIISEARQVQETIVNKKPAPPVKEVRAPQPESVSRPEDVPVEKEETVEPEEISFPSENPEPLAEYSEPVPETQVGSPDHAVSFHNDVTGDSSGEKDGIDFSFINRKIKENLKYPAIARRYGWEGKVVLSFILLKDGSVKDIMVIRSSGRKVLDDCAISVVRKSAPFQVRETETEIIIPIVYSLAT